MTLKFEPVLLPVMDLHEYPLNPNEEDTSTFNNLVDEIMKDGWDEPVVVVPRDVVEPGMPGYTVVSGNHRLKAAKALNFEEIPAIIKEDWDAETAKIKVVRRNMMKGELNAKKFIKLVDSMEETYTPEQLANALGFKDLESFENVYNQEQANFHFAAKKAISAKEEESLIDGLSIILNRMFTEYGHTVPYSFMFFLFGNKIHLTVQANTRLKELIEIITKRCVDDQLDISTVLTGLLALGVKTSNFIDGPPDRDTIEQMAKESDHLEKELDAVTND